MKLTNFSLKEIVTKIQEAESLDELKSLEDECLLYFSMAEKSGKNWIQKNEAKSMQGQVQQLVSHRRRAIMRLPDIAKAQADYALGQKIGRKI